MSTLHHAAPRIDTVRAWDGPAAVAARGTLIVVPGRGEHAAVYDRFGARLAVDGYRVRAVGDPTRDARSTAADVARLLADDSLPAPRVLVGSDAGALFAIAQAIEHRDRVDAVVLAGLPVDDRRTALDWSAELDARTSCPTHQTRLSADRDVEHGALVRPVPPDWPAVDLGRLDVPVLGLHGEDDAISPLSTARAAYERAAHATLVTIVGGRHDALNDATHRTAAATVVLFLERLRLGADLPLIARTGGPAA